jgi:hypothetical protein
MPKNYIGSTDVLPTRIHHEKEEATPTPNEPTPNEPTPNEPTPNEPAQPAVFYLDGASFVGAGTQSDPVRFSGTYNSVNGGEFSSVAPIAIAFGDVWFDGQTITPKYAPDMNGAGTDTNPLKLVGDSIYGPGPDFVVNMTPEIFESQLH